MQTFNSARPEKNIRLGAVLALIVVALVALVTWRSISRMVRDAGWVEHTMLVIDNIDKLERQMTQRQAAERVYQLTHNPVFLDQYKNLSADVRQTLRDLNSETVDNPRQQEELRAFTSLLHESEVALGPATE